MNRQGFLNPLPKLEWLPKVEGGAYMRLTGQTPAVYDSRDMRTAPGRKAFLLICPLILTGLSSLPSGAQSRPVPSPQLAAKDVNARADALLKKMTLDEKIGQLVQYSAGFATGPAASNLTYDDLVAKGQVGSMLNVVGAEKTNHYQHIAVEKSRLHIPIIFGSTLSTATTLRFPSRLPWRRAGILRLPRRSHAQARWKHVQTASAGSSRLWWISRAIPDGAASLSRMAKIPIS